MPTTCEIDIEDNPYKVIHSGQLLCGTVTLKLTKNKKIRGIFIKITGSAHAHWTTGGKNSSSYTRDEDYLNEKKYLLGGNLGKI